MVFLALFSPRTRGRKSRWGGGDLEEKMEEECYFSGCPPTPLSLDGFFAF